MPDNRGVKLNPEDSVPPAYLDTLDERDRVRLDAARRQGESFVPIFPGRGQAPGYTQPAGGVEFTRSVTETPPSLQHQPGGRVAPQPTYEAYSPPRQEGRPEAPAMAERNDLGQAMISLVRDLEPGLLLLVSALCYVLALFAFAQGLLRLLKTSEDKFHAPSGGGTALSFLICIVMAALPSWLSAAGESLFGSGARPAAASLGYGARGADYDALLAAVFTVVSLVGLFAFIRGAFTLRAAADGKPVASGPKAFAHMAGGIAAWHIVAVIDAVQTSRGIAVLDIR